MGAGDFGAASFRFQQGAVDQLVGDGIGKEDHQIRLADLSAQIAAHFGEHLCLMSVLFADGFVLLFHSLVSANDDNTHILILLGWRFYLVSIC